MVQRALLHLGGNQRSVLSVLRLQSEVPRSVSCNVDPMNCNAK